MKVAVTTSVELVNPRLEIDINLDKCSMDIVLKHTCPNCAGYGCHHSHCDDTIKLAPQDVIRTLGPSSKELLANFFESILRA